jgi:hypothetical protein
MVRTLIRVIACGLILHGPTSAGLFSHQAYAQAASTQQFSIEQLDALLSPIALYPDELLAQVLMASTFPLEVVSAQRWVEDPAHKSLTGDALGKAVATQSWDPSVKSLVPFPQVLALLNSNLDWMQQLGFAFANDPAEVMKSVQRLRAQAQAAGSLQSTTQQVVRREQQTIIIEPAQPNVVYVPSYNPTTVYGAWPYPSYPPVYLPPPPGYAIGSALVSGMAFATGVAVVGSLWGWARPGWNSGQVNVNVNRYNNMNVNRAQIRSNVWQPNRPAGRPAGFQRPPNGPVGQPARRAGVPANAVGRSNVTVPRSAVNRPARPPAEQANVANRQAGAGRAQANAGNRPNATAARADRQAAQRPAPQRQRQPEAFRGMDSGRQAAQFGNRGSQSRAASQTHQQARGGGRAAAHSGDGAPRSRR